MGVSTGAALMGVVIAMVGFFVLMNGVVMFMDGPMVSGHTERNEGLLGIGGSSSSSGSFNPAPLLGLVLVPIGGVMLYAGLKGTMGAFERGQERAEGTRHHLTVKRE